MQKRNVSFNSKGDVQVTPLLGHSLLDVGVSFACDSKRIFYLMNMAVTLILEQNAAEEAISQIFQFTGRPMFIFI
jgi:hypothetical protein